MTPGPEADGPAVITVFRNRLNVEDPDAVSEYHETAQRMLELARAMPGFVDFKTFEADDGERVSIITFSSPAAQRAWRDHPEHRQAQQRGRDRFYTSYDIVVGQVVGESHFPRR